MRRAPIRSRFTEERVLQERELFREHHPHLDLTMAKDAWDRPIFAAPMVEALFEGWKTRQEVSEHLGAA